METQRYRVHADAVVMWEGNQILFGRPSQGGVCRSLLVLVLVLPLLATTVEAQGPDFTSLFDGSSLDGWEGNHQLFLVVDGSIVGGTLDARIPADEFLCTAEEFEDFELRLEARMTPGQIGGVQFRGQRVPGSTQVAGYQADMGFVPGIWIPRLSDMKGVDPEEAYPLWGSLLDEYRPERSRYPDPAAPYRLIAVADRKVVDPVLKPGDWNSLSITAVDSLIEIRLNGTKTVDYLEREDVPRTGVICVQIHSGPPAQASYRNILIRRIAG